MSRSLDDAFVVPLPVAWRREDPALDERLDLLERQSRALRWERLLHRIRPFWTDDIHHASFHYLGSGTIQCDMVSVEWEEGQREEARLLNMPTPLQTPEDLARDRDRRARRAARANRFEQEVKLPFERELQSLLAAEGFPADWIRNVLGCELGLRKNLTWTDLVDRSQAAIKALVGAEREAARLEVILDAAPASRAPRL